MVQVGSWGWVSANYAALSCGNFPKCNTTWGFAIGDLVPFFKLGNAADTGTGYEFGVLDHYARTSIHMLHRIGAGIITLYWGIFLGFLIWHKHAASLCKRIAGVFCGLLAVQLVLGVSNVLLKLPLVIALGHNVCAALLILCGLRLVASLTTPTEKAYCL